MKQKPPTIVVLCTYIIGSVNGSDLQAFGSYFNEATLQVRMWYVLESSKGMQESSFNTKTFLSTFTLFQKNKSLVRQLIFLAYFFISTQSSKTIIQKPMQVASYPGFSFCLSRGGQKIKRGRVQIDWVIRVCTVPLLLVIRCPNVRVSTWCQRYVSDVLHLYPQS